MSDVDPMLADTLGEIGNIMMGAGATNLAGLLGERVDITAPSVMLGSAGDLWPEGRALLVEVSMIGALEGDSMFVLPASDVEVIVDIMMAGMSLPAEEVLGEMGLSAVGEAMNQLMAGSAIALSDVLGELVDITPPRLTLVDDVSELDISEDKLRVRFDVFIGDRLRGQLSWMLDGAFGNRLVDRVTEGMGGGSGQAAADRARATAAAAQAEEPAPSPEPPTAPQPPPHPSPEPVAQPAPPPPPPVAPVPQVEVTPASYPELTPVAVPASAADLALLSDVTLAITVELGRTQLLVKDLLDLAEGSVVELDRPAGAPVDILVNGTLVARGDVVVVDDELGVRVSEVLQPEERRRQAS